MSRINRPRTGRRSYAATVVAAVTLAASIALSTPASAHVQVEAAGARALDKNVSLRFTAATESDTAGITALEVILPDGIVPADITYAGGPEGWKLTPTAGGYTVSGPEMAVGQPAAYAVTVRQLPYLKSLAFKTLQTYGDGRVDRWVEPAKPSGAHDAKHGKPAPVLVLAPAAPGAKPAAGATASADAVPGEIPGASSRAGASEETSGGANPALIIGFVVVVVALVGGTWWFRRRGGASRA
ncbi:YcnI family protein [Streptomyces sp. NBC_01317]|uniref:DUF1775 domain-containing protein n=1 Tax=Streptomyces sp. NBC_01317 TaxID=2903822 RepID=UPI002E14F7AC|nr:YcnI family protein [Streptomyces sp. NBC_01317]